MNLTIAYITSRRDPKIEWFLDSLQREVESLPAHIDVTLIIVDLQAPSRTHRTLSKYGRIIKAMWVEPKPSVWQGRFRLTEQDFFSAANCRNTALAVAPDGYIAFVDDLSVLCPNWIKPIVRLMDGPDDYVLCGSFQKVLKLKVEQGAICYFEAYKEGIDPRFLCGEPNIDVVCSPQWMFGCSIACPVDYLLNVNGFPELLCDGMGYEDCVMGTTMARRGNIFRYSLQMHTKESEEDHHNQQSPLRYDPGKSPLDKSHRLLEVNKGQTFFEQSFGNDFKTISELRQHMLNGGLFPVRREPTTEWFTGIDLRDFHMYNPDTSVIVPHTKPPNDTIKTAAS